MENDNFLSDDWNRQSGSLSVLQNAWQYPNNWTGSMVYDKMDTTTNIVLQISNINIYEQILDLEGTFP